MNSLPTITEQKIRTFVGEQNFPKSQQHVRDEAIVNPEQQAMALNGYCYEPVQVQDSHLTKFLVVLQKWR